MFIYGSNEHKKYLIKKLNMAVSSFPLAIIQKRLKESDIIKLLEKKFEAHCVMRWGKNQ